MYDINLHSLVFSLPRRYKLSFFLILFLFVLSSLLEISTAFIVYIFVSLLTNPSLATINSLSSLIPHHYSLTLSPSSVAVFLAFTVVLSSCLKIYNYSFSFNWSRNVGNHITSAIYYSLIGSNVNSFSLLSNDYILTLLTKNLNLAISALIFFLLGTSSLILSVLFLTFLLVFNSINIIFPAIFLIFIYLSIFSFNRPFLTRNSDLITRSTQDIIGLITDSAAMHKTIILSNLELYFTNMLYNYSDRLRSSEASNRFISVFPRPLIEMVLILCVCIFVILSPNTNFLAEIIPTASLLLVSANKLIPALQSVYTSVSAIADRSDSIKAVSRVYIAIDKRTIPRFPSRFLAPKSYSHHSYTSLVIRNCSLKYSDSPSSVFKDFNLSLKFPFRLCIIGSSGSGKSSLVNIISGLIPPSSGSILVDSQDLFSDRQLLKKWHSSVSYVPQNTHIFSGSIFSNITLDFNLLHSCNTTLLRRVKEVCAISQIDHFINSLPNSYGTVIGDRGLTLSGGQKQRISLARALFSNKPILILDESTSSIDPSTESMIFEKLSYLNISIIYVTHNHDLSRFSSTTVDFNDI